MKATPFLCLVFLACSLSVVTAVADVCAQTSSQKMNRYNCGKDRSGTLYCQRVAPAGRVSGQEGIYTEKSAGKVCKWKCKTEQGIEICQASGSECNGRTPPHWR